MFRALRDSRAFSTVEAMVAAVVCGIVFVSLYGGISCGIAYVRLTRENLRAIQIMQEKMETIRLYRWDQINQSGFIPTNFIASFYPVAGQGSTGINYTGAVTIAASPISEYYSDSLKQVTVNLNWLSGRVVRQRSMMTFVSQYGLQGYVYGISR